MSEKLDMFYHTKKCEGTITESSARNDGIRFYHTKKCEGTITPWLRKNCKDMFYHTKKCEGTITAYLRGIAGAAFYHTKKCEGTIIRLSAASPVYHICFEIQHKISSRRSLAARRACRPLSEVKETAVPTTPKWSGRGDFRGRKLIEMPIKMCYSPYR